jgi:type II secretory pathway component GspD/PulD (secretin)
MKISAQTKATLHRTLSALVVATTAVIAQDNSPAPAPTAPAPIAPPIAPQAAPAPIAPPGTGNAAPAPIAPAAIAPPVTGGIAPAAIEPPVTTPGLPEGGAQPGLPTDPNAPGAVPGTPPPPPSFDTNAPAGAVSEFQGDEIGLVLRTLARQANMSINLSQQVQGTVTLRVLNKTPREVIDIIAEGSNLIVEDRKGVTWIKTKAEKAQEPTVSAQYTFSYAQAESIMPLLQTQLTSGVAPQFDKRTNTVYYRDNQSNLEKVRKFLEGIDGPTQQVMIEARLVEVNANPKQAYGFNWAGVVGSTGSPQQIKYGASGIPAAGSNSLTQTVREGTGGKYQFNDFLRDGTRGGNFMNNLAGQFAILSIPQMSVTMRLLNEDGDAEFLANPRIVASNNQEATIKITRTQPVPNLNFNEQQAKAVFGGFQDKEFGNTLKVTPVINKDKYVSLKVQPEISNKVGDATFVFEGATVSSPVIDKRTFDSNVLIRSGDTLAIGGLLQDESQKGRVKVPIAGDIPLFGYLFQEKTAARTKRNLLVFVTPTIIPHGYGTGLENQVSGLTHSGEEYADPNGWRNNAKGAVRLRPTSNRALSADYPKPGLPPLPRK